MGESRYRRETMELLALYGREVRRTRHGTLYSLRDGQIVMVGTSHNGGDNYHGDRNENAKLKRALADAGIETNEEGKMTEDLKIVGGYMGRGGSLNEHPGIASPAKVGIHVQRRKRILEIQETEATVDAAALARGIGIEVPTGSRVELRDADGDVVTGPLVILIETSVEREEPVA